MSDKSKVYPGVRVKTTVRELLQRHRAREANRKNAKTIISQARLDLQKLSASLYPTAPAPVPDVSTLQVPYPASYSVHECLSSNQIQDLNTYNNNFQQQLWDAGQPSNSGPSNHLHEHMYQQHPQQHHNGQNYQSLGLPPSWDHGLSSDADYYGPGMTSCSPADSLKMCSPDDHNSYSPHNSFSSSSSTSLSSCYDSPSRLESSFFSPEPYPYTQHYLSQDSYNMAHLQQEAFSTSEYAPYYNSMDYVYPCTEESFYKRDLTAEIYNAL